MDGIVSSWSSEDYDKKNIELKPITEKTDLIPYNYTQ